MIQHEDSARELLAANVKSLMEKEGNEDKSTPAKLAAKCFWPATAGPKRRGKRLSERYIRYVIAPKPDDQHSPSIDVVSAIAEAFGTETWRLLVNERQLRRYLVGKLSANDDSVDRHPQTAPSVHEMSPYGLARARRESPRAKK